MIAAMLIFSIVALSPRLELALSWNIAWFIATAVILMGMFFVLLRLLWLRFPSLLVRLESADLLKNTGGATKCILALLMAAVCGLIAGVSLAGLGVLRKMLLRIMIKS